MSYRRFTIKFDTDNQMCGVWFTDHNGEWVRQVELFNSATLSDLMIEMEALENLGYRFCGTTD